MGPRTKGDKSINPLGGREGVAEKKRRGTATGNLYEFEIFWEF